MTKRGFRGLLPAGLAAASVTQLLAQGIGPSASGAAARSEAVVSGAAQSWALPTRYFGLIGIVVAVFCLAAAWHLAGKEHAKSW